MDAGPTASFRGRVEARLDRLVRDNRFTLAVTIPAVGAVLLVAASRGVLPADLVRDPALLLVAVAAMRLPLIAGVLPTVGRRALAGLLALSGFAYAVEFVGVTTGVPYGHFAYTADLGPTLAGVVPLALPLLYVPLVVDAYLLGLALLGRFGGGGNRVPAGRLAGHRTARVLAGVAALLAIDLVLDPGAVAVGFWAYEAGGAYYDVPLSNFVGWALSGTVAILLVDAALDRTALTDRLSEAPYTLDDLVSFLVLWGGVNLVVGNWLAVLAAVALAVAVASADGLPARADVAAATRWTSR